MITIFLSGFMACGKTTVAKTFARRTDCEFIDLDEYIEKKIGAKVPDIFKDYGEEFFRKTEAECLREICGKNAIVACGGGTMTDGKNYGTVKLCGGIVVFIDTPFPYCRDRIRREPGTRPLADNKNDVELHELFDTRHPLYEKNSDCKVDGVDPSLVIVAEIMTEIVKLIEKKTDEDLAEVDKEVGAGQTPASDSSGNNKK